MDDYYLGVDGMFDDIGDKGDYRFEAGKGWIPVSTIISYQVLFAQAHDLVSENSRSKRGRGDDITCNENERNYTINDEREDGVVLYIVLSIFSVCLLMCCDFYLSAGDER